VKLISIYTILSEGKDFKEPKGISKFFKVKDWIPPITLIKLKVTKSKTPDNRIFF